MHVQPVFQPQTAYAKGMSAATIAGDGGRRDGKASPASFSVDIGEAARAMLAAEQKAAPADAGDGELPVGIRHMLERMADDPAFGAEYADGYAKNIHTACMTLPEFLQGKDTLEAGRQELQTVWQDILAQGKLPAQSYADLLRHELSMPQGYWDAMGGGHGGESLHALAGAKLAYLEQYLAKKPG